MPNLGSDIRPIFRKIVGIRFINCGRLKKPIIRGYRWTLQISTSRYTRTKTHRYDNPHKMWNLQENHDKSLINDEPPYLPYAALVEHYKKVRSVHKSLQSSSVKHPPTNKMGSDH